MTGIKSLYVQAYTRILISELFRMYNNRNAAILIAKAVKASGAEKGLRAVEKIRL